MLSRGLHAPPGACWHKGSRCSGVPKPLQVPAIKNQTVLLVLRRYEVRKKKGKLAECMEEMGSLIAERFADRSGVQCGIVYCLSKNDCERVSDELQSAVNQHSRRKCRIG